MQVSYPGAGGKSYTPTILHLFNIASIHDQYLPFNVCLLLFAIVKPPVLRDGPPVLILPLASNYPGNLKSHPFFVPPWGDYEGKVAHSVTTKETDSFSWSTGDSKAMGSYFLPEDSFAFVTIFS